MLGISFFLGESHGFGSVPWELAWGLTQPVRSLCKVEVDHALERPLCSHEEIGLFLLKSTCYDLAFPVFKK